MAVPRPPLLYRTLRLFPPPLMCRPQRRLRPPKRISRQRLLHLELPFPLLGEGAVLPLTLQGVSALAGFSSAYSCQGCCRSSGRGGSGVATRAVIPLSSTKLDFVQNLPEGRNERPWLGRISSLDQTITRGQESAHPARFDYKVAGAL